jgi:hypothetical protein
MEYTPMDKDNEHNPLAIYQIRVRGHLDSRWSEWFNGFSIMYWQEGTVLLGSVPDQAALHGMLAKIRDLGLTILLVENLVQRVGDDNEEA